ncbi:hypothetical protein FRC01_007221 [Tulasnella sp. 417]|nr:hypothetical protein FRC01_007221 [Tulasnella sp. 417]
MSTTSTSHDTASRSNAIAFIGLGAMGREMASNLFTKSLNAQGSEPSPTFIVCDALPDAAASFARNFQQLHPGVHISVVDTPAKAAELASVIITMLPSSPQVNQVYLSSESGILPGVLKALSSSAPHRTPEDLKTLAIDSTTLDVSTAKEVAQRVAKEAQISMVDAPDMNLALNAADSVGVPLPLGNSSVKLYEDVTKDEDLAVRDFSVVFRHLQKLQQGQQ